MNENDLRVQRTRRLLREALIGLVSSQSYEQLTVRDITNRAQVGYRTFYRHYESKDALLHAIIQEILGDFQRALLSPAALDAPEKNTLIAVRFARENAGLLRIIFSSATREEFLIPLVKLGLKEGKLFFGNSNTPDELVAHHFVSSILSLLQWWLDSEMPYSVEEMAEYINRLVIRPLKNLQMVE